MPILLPSHTTAVSEQFNTELNKALLLQYFTRVSGTGVLAYNSAAASTEGVGRFEFTGTGRWELIFNMPINVNKGFSYRASHQQATGAGTVSIGLKCMDSMFAALGDRTGFFSGGAPGVSTFVDSL